MSGNRGAAGSSTKALNAALEGAQISLFQLGKVVSVASSNAEFVANIAVGAVPAVHLFLLNIYLIRISAIIRIIFNSS